MSELLHDLGRGLPGTVVYEGLLARGSGLWEAAHRAARAMTAQSATGYYESASLFYGAPAVAFALHTAGHPAYRSALADLDKILAAVVEARLFAAHHRMRAGRPPRMREYDLISGLTGLGVYFLHRDVRPETLHYVLRYLVRLLRKPLCLDRHELPGWWTSDRPTGRPGRGTWDGHVNFGLAHGVAGPIALLALADRAGHTVPGQREALEFACQLLEQWAQPTSGGGSAWPETVPMSVWLGGPFPQFRAGRPSWCYGTPGIARALQLAAIACGRSDSRRRAETLLAACVQDADQLARVTDATVCHGWAGVYLAVHRAAAEEGADSSLYSVLPELRARFSAHLAQNPLPEGAGLLTGADGVRLTIETIHPSHPVSSGWEACLLLS